jgi:hypothetical protein
VRWSAAEQGRDKDVAMKASAFKFDPDRKVLVTNMTKDQIKKLPEIKS